MAWADWLVVEQSLEEELELEQTVRGIRKTTDLKELQELCAAMIRQQWHQRKLLCQAIERIAEFDAMEACLD